MLLSLLLLPLALATGDYYGGGDRPRCSTATVSTVTVVWTTIPKPQETVTRTTWGGCYDTVTKTNTKATTVPGTKTVTETITPTTWTRLPPSTVTKTYTATVTREVKDGSDPNKDWRKREAEAEAEAEPRLTNAQRLARGLPPNPPTNFGRKRVYPGVPVGAELVGRGGGGGGGYYPPSCTPTTKTITATVTKTDRPCPTTTVTKSYCKTVSTTVDVYIPTTTFGTKTTTVTGKPSTITKPPITTTTVKTTVTTTATKPCKRDANGNIIEE